MKMKTIRGAGTTKEFFGADKMRGTRIGGLDKDHQINRSRLVTALIRNGTMRSHHRESKYMGDGKYEHTQTDEEYLESIMKSMRATFAHTYQRRQAMKFIENALSLRAGYNSVVAENGAGRYSIFSRRQSVYDGDDSVIGIHFRPEGWTAEDGGAGIPKNVFRCIMLKDEQINNDDWTQLAPMMGELLSISGLVNDLTNRNYKKTDLDRKRAQLTEMKQKFDEADWDAEQKKDEEIQAWLDSAPSHAKLNAISNYEDGRFRNLRGKSPVAQVVENRKRAIVSMESAIKQLEDKLAKNIHLDHLNSDSLKASEQAKWNQIVDTVFGIGGEEE